MSWSISSTGKRDEVRKSVGETFDACAVGYTSQGLREGNDLLALRAVVLGAIDTLVLEESEEVVVYCYGSRGESTYMTASLSVTKRACAKPVTPPDPPATSPDPVAAVTPPSGPPAEPPPAAPAT